MVMDYTTLFCPLALIDAVIKEVSNILAFRPLMKLYWSGWEIVEPLPPPPQTFISANVTARGPKYV